MAEEWRLVPGWACETSGPGQVRTLAGGLPYVLARSHDTKGYPKVTVGGRTVRVQRLMALSWLPKPRKGKTQVRHLDGNKENCAAWNLKWGDQRDQEQDKRHAGTRSRAQRVSRNGSENQDRVKRGTGWNGSERRGKEGNKTGASGATETRTSRT